MPYISTIEDLKGLIPEEFLVQALDDNGDGAEDTGLLAAIVADAEREIHGYCRQRYVTPFSAPVPDLIVDAAKILTAYRLYVRRGRGGEANPLRDDASRIRRKLQAVAEGDEQLTADQVPQNSPAVVIEEESRIHTADAVDAGANRNNMI
jgi:phage gp36-like protein